MITYQNVNSGYVWMLRLEIIFILIFFCFAFYMLFFFFFLIISMVYFYYLETTKKLFLLWDYCRGFINQSPCSCLCPATVLLSHTSEERFCWNLLGKVFLPLWSSPSCLPTLPVFPSLSEKKHSPMASTGLQGPNQPPPTVTSFSDLIFYLTSP